jgi:hypothetical protein
MEYLHSMQSMSFTGVAGTRYKHFKKRRGGNEELGAAWRVKRGAVRVRVRGIQPLSKLHTWPHGQFSLTLISRESGRSLMWVASS